MVTQIDIIYLAQKVTEMPSEEGRADIACPTKEKPFWRSSGLALMYLTQSKEQKQVHLV